MKIIRFLRSIYTNIIFFVDGILEWKLDSLKYFWAVKRGFERLEIDVLGITKDNQNNYLSEKEYRKGHPYNGAYSSIIDNKLYLPLLFADCKEYLPEYYFFIDEYGLLELNGEKRRVDYEAFFERLSKDKIVCLKHCYSSLGKGFMLVKIENDKIFVNGNETSKNEIIAILKESVNYIVTEYIYQHEYASNICSTSLNTIRFVFVYDGDEKTFRLVRSFHRFGCNGSVVDNQAAGNGVCTYVDIAKGELSNKSEFRLGGGKIKLIYDVIHPDNNVLLTGIELPRFFEIRDKIIEILNKKSFLKYCGFDIAITANSFKIVEINSLPSFSQPDEGYLSEPWMRKFFKR
jgi:hypothetical protein